MSTYLEIQEQIKLLQVQAEELRKAEVDSVIADMKNKIQQYGISAAELGFHVAAPVTRKKAATEKEELPAKYKGPNGELWSGSNRGRKPKWVQEVIEAGGNIEDYLIHE